MENEKENRYVERLLDNSTGYIRMPQAVKDVYGTPKKWGNPSWKVTKDDDDVLEISFVFEKKNMK